MKTLAVYEQLGLLALSTVEAGTFVPGDVHVFHSHSPLWAYCDPALARPFAGNAEGEFGLEVFAFPPRDTTLAEARQRTRFLVFLGAVRTPQMDEALLSGDGVCLVFEPDPARMAAFLDGFKPHALAGKGLFFVAGDPDRLPTSLLDLLPENIASLGYPIFFEAQGLAEALPGYVRRVEELIELFYYRNAIYPLDSQENVRGLPLRPMVRNAIYDRYKHLYENLTPCLRSGILNDLLGALTGCTAILAAAGPALNDQLEFIRNNQDRAAIIAVNSALKPLLAAGIEPHFVVINDTSMDSEPTLAELPKLSKARLVAHCLSTSGGGSFEHAYFFGNFPGQPFPKRPSLLLHGSVITTAFSLAEYMGCTKAILAGVQLSSPDPLVLNYAEGATKEGQTSGKTELELTNTWPELYPLNAADGRCVFTTLNFLDSAQWFADRIRMAGLDVVNLTASSILKGPGIIFDPAPSLPEAPELTLRLESLPSTDFSSRHERVREFIVQEMTRWKAKERAARAAYDGLGPAAALIAACDQDNSSFMLQRFWNFDNAKFHAGYFEATSDEQRLKAAEKFSGYMQHMAKSLLSILKDQLAKID